MTNIFKKLKSAIKNARDERDKVAIAKALEFAGENGRYAVMLMDLNSDDVVVAWKKHYIATRFVNKLTKTKKHVVKRILSGGDRDKELQDSIGFVGNVVMEFLFQLNKHAQQDKDYENAKKDGFEGTFKDYVESKQVETVEEDKSIKEENGKDI